jgi:hypothetical protein
MNTSHVVRYLGMASLSLATLVTASPVMAADTRLSVGSPASPFSQKKQNEPAVALDASNTRVLAA